MRWWNRFRSGVLASLLLALTGVAAQTLPPAPASPKELRAYAKLQAKAARQGGHNKAATLATMAEYEFDFSHAAYIGGHPGAGGREMDLATQHADQACQLLEAEAERGKTDGMKNVEISIQRVGYGLQDLAQRVDFRSRPKVQAAARHFSDLRTKLLLLMFAPKH